MSLRCQRKLACLAADALAARTTFPLVIRLQSHFPPQGPDRRFASVAFSRSPMGADLRTPAEVDVLMSDGPDEGPAEGDPNDPEASEADNLPPGYDIDLMNFGPSPWPFLSSADEALSQVSSGQFWPFRPRDEEKLEESLPSIQLSTLDLAVLARTACALGAQSEEQRLLLQRLNSAEAEALLPQCSPVVLSVLVSSLGDLPLEAGCNGLFLKVVGQLLEVRSLSPRHALVLMTALGRGGGGSGTVLTGQQPAVPSLAVMRAAATALVDEQKALSSVGSVLPDALEVLAALEGLSRLRAWQPLEAYTDQLVSQVAASLLPFLGGGPGLARLLASATPAPRPGARITSLRFLASFALLPEATGHLAASYWLSSLSFLRWSEHPVVEEETMGKAAFTLARCGAWNGGRAGFLLAQVLRRDLEARADVEGTSNLTPAAGSWWLAAIAQSGLPLNGATDKPDGKFAEHTEEALLSCAEALALADGKQSGTASTAAAARALWAVCAMGKASERGNIAAALLSRIAASEPTTFSAETWALLREVKQTMGAEEGGGEVAEGGQDGEGAEAQGPFSTEAWRKGIASAAEAENGLFKASSRAAELRAALTDALAAEMAETAAIEAGEDAAEDEGAEGSSETTEFEADFAAGPYTLALHVPSRGVAIDLDANVSSVNRALRRQQWSALLPDLRVAEITLAQWDKLGGRERAQLVREALKGAS
ncbi:unnamed protein product [Polarella glacialis]|uniref:Uncharacterized protein n=1 Tax=Polarella glacialis TaxID=89957 RepID=A0A813KCW0_POLGL|nr:unnamed protein product [Polarella glacialis]